MAAYGTAADLDAAPLDELRRMLQGSNEWVQQFRRTASGGPQADLHMHISPEGARFSHALLCEDAALIVWCRDMSGDGLFRACRGLQRCEKVRPPLTRRRRRSEEV